MKKTDPNNRPRKRQNLKNQNLRNQSLIKQNSLTTLPDFHASESQERTSRDMLFQVHFIEFAEHLNKKKRERYYSDIPHRKFVSHHGRARQSPSLLPPVRVTCAPQCNC